jgi:formylglycine-generating enzyme required for sulfatase activity
MEKDKLKGKKEKQIIRVKEGISRKRFLSYLAIASSSGAFIWDWWTSKGKVLEINNTNQKSTSNNNNITNKESRESFTEFVGEDINLEMIAIPAGSFMMGSNDGYENQKIHKVNLKGFHIGKYPITQTQYQAVMGENYSYFSNAENASLYQEWGNHPVDSVTWLKAVEFCQKLSLQTGKNYKLPSEAQWEYACRAGSTGKWCFGNDEKQLKDYAWYQDNSEHQTHPVGQKKPNQWGLYDMHGNVWEWCEHYDYEQTLISLLANILQNTESDTENLLRGGSWYTYSLNCSSASRTYYDVYSDENVDGFGFRVVCV